MNFEGPQPLSVVAESRRQAAIVRSPEPIETRRHTAIANSPEPEETRKTFMASMAKAPADLLSLSQDDKPKANTTIAAVVQEAPKPAANVTSTATVKVSTSVKKEADKIIAKAKAITDKEATPAPANTNSTKAAEPKK